MSFMSRVISSETVLPNLEHQLSKVSEIKKKVYEKRTRTHIKKPMTPMRKETTKVIAYAVFIMLLKDLGSGEAREISLAGTKSRCVGESGRRAQGECRDMPRRTATKLKEISYFSCRDKVTG